MGQNQLIHVFCAFLFLKVVQEIEDPDLLKGDPVGLKKSMNAPISEQVSAISLFHQCRALDLQQFKTQKIRDCL